MIARVAPQATSVLVLGEAARARNSWPARCTSRAPLGENPSSPSLRRSHGIVARNRELFGHEKGAFTDAVRRKKASSNWPKGAPSSWTNRRAGRPPCCKATARGAAARIRARRRHPHFELDVRLIAATNRDLNAEVRRGAFREDLYHRLNVVALHVPL